MGLVAHAQKGYTDLQNGWQNRHEIENAHGECGVLREFSVEKKLVGTITWSRDNLPCARCFSNSSYRPVAVLLRQLKQQYT